MVNLHQRLRPIARTGDVFINSLLPYYRGIVNIKAKVIQPSGAKETMSILLPFGVGVVYQEVSRTGPWSLWTLEYVVFLSVEATISDFLADSVVESENSFDSLSNCYMLFLAVYVCYLAFVACAGHQLAAGFVKIAKYHSFEVNVVVYAAVTLVAGIVKIMFIRVGLTITLYSGVWFVYSAHVCLVAVAYRGLFITRAAPLVLLPPAPIVLEDVGHPTASLARAQGGLWLHSAKQLRTEGCHRGNLQ